MHGCASAWRRSPTLACHPTQRQRAAIRARVLAVAHRRSALARADAALAILPADVGGIGSRPAAAGARAPAPRRRGGAGPRWWRWPRPEPGPVRRDHVRRAARRSDVRGPPVDRDPDPSGRPVGSRARRAGAARRSPCGSRGGQPRRRHGGRRGGTGRVRRHRGRGIDASDPCRRRRRVSRPRGGRRNQHPGPPGPGDPAAGAGVQRDRRGDRARDRAQRRSRRGDRPRRDRRRRDGGGGGGQRRTTTM